MTTFSPIAISANTAALNSAMEKSVAGSVVMIGGLITGRK